MRWVDQATCRPFRCAVVPYVGNGSGHAFLDTGQDLDLEHVYISDVGCEAIAQELGWVPPQELSRAREEVVALNHRVAQLEDQLQEADRFAEAAEYTLEKFGSKVRKKPGPKKSNRSDKREEVAA